MSAKLIDGKAIAERIILDLKGQITKLNRPPGLAVILIGNDPASHLYVRNKKKAALKVGINFHDYFCAGRCHPNITEKKILEMVDFLNNDPTIDGIIVQLPIPKKFNTKKILERIKPQKDVDGFYWQNNSENQVGTNSPLIAAITTAIKETKENLDQKRAVIITKNPTFIEIRRKALEELGLIVKIIKPDDNLEKETKQADVLIVIVGEKKLITKSMVKPGAIVIDVGTNLVGENKWAGDVEPEVAEVASWLTPVPGGIGPLTVAYLLKNTYELAKNNLNLSPHLSAGY